MKLILMTPQIQELTMINIIITMRIKIKKKKKILVISWFRRRMERNYLYILLPLLSFTTIINH